MDNDEFIMIDRQDAESGSDEDVPPSKLSPGHSEYKTLNTAVTEEDLEEIRSWLSPTEFDSEGSEFRKHLKAHVLSTGDWLFRTEQYITWHDTDSATLWIQGVPGSGKSVVAANLIRTLKSENAPVLFFFSRRIIKLNSNPCNLVRDCLYQLLDHSISLQRRLKSFVKQHSDVSKVLFHELWRLLLPALATIPKVYLVFDALDELNIEEDGFLDSLLSLGKRRSNSIKLLITSRPITSLQEALTNLHCEIIRLTGRKVQSDIATYVSHRLLHQQERNVTKEEISRIKDVLCKKSQGLFLYTRLILDEILFQSVPLAEQLHSLPRSLTDMYVDLLYEHSARSGVSLHFQSKLLSWVTHASRPLRTSEIAALVNSHSDRCGLDDSQDAKTMARTSCGPLLEILDDETVQVIHHSFTEFLLDNDRITTLEAAQSKKWFPAFSPTSIHRSMTLSCLDYLMSGCFDSRSAGQTHNDISYDSYPTQKQLMVRFHFLQYSSKNLLYHAARCDTSEGALLSKFDQFFQYGNNNFESWKDLRSPRRKMEDDNTDNVRPLHIAAQAGLTAYTLHLLDKNEDLNLQDDQGRSAVAYAAMHGHVETLAALLSYGASLTINDLDGLAPIHHAAKGNHFKALQYLLDAGADPLSPKRNEGETYSFQTSTLGTTPLQYACELGNSDAVIVLLERLSPSTRSKILPHWASSRGQARALSVLFQYPEILANINKRDICGNTALYLAGCIRDSSTVRILLQHKADVHLKSYDLVNSQEEPANYDAAENSMGHTPLQGWAKRKRYVGYDEHHTSVEEWEKTFTLLIEAGSDIEARDEKGRTILFDWMGQGRYGRGDLDRTERFVSILLKHGANPRAVDNDGNTAIHQNRTWNSNLKVVELLAKAGADMNATRAGDLATPLIASAKDQCLDGRMYFDNGADPNLQDIDGNTALHYICRSWLTELEHIKEWLTFADPTIKNNKGETCIYNLRWGNGGAGRVQAIALFVEKGVDLESRDKQGRSALMAACQNAEPHFIHGLLRCGADAKSRDFKNKSCLHVVAQNLMSNNDHGAKDKSIYMKTLEKLVHNGADINGVDFEGNTPFFEAVTSINNLATLEIRLNTLLEVGAIANTINNWGRTALHEAIMAGRSSLEYRNHLGFMKQIDFLLKDHLQIDLHIQDHEGMMAIHYGALISEFAVWKLTEAGADISAQANNGKVPLHFAAKSGRSNTVGLLLQLYGGESGIVNHKDELGRTPLHYATASGNSESVYYLIRSGADLNIQDKQGLAPLHTCAEHTFDISKVHLQRGNRTSLSWRNVPPGLQQLYPYMDTRRDRPLHNNSRKISQAIAHESESQNIQDVVDLLLTSGANIHARDAQGQTVCDVALFLDNTLLATIIASLDPLASKSASLLEESYHNRNVNSETTEQFIDIEEAESYKALQGAISLQNHALLDSLIKAGVDLTIAGPDGLTIVHTIVHWGLISMMKLVASHIQGLNSFTPPLLHVAASREQSNVQMIDLLIGLGADVNASYEEVDDEHRRSTGDPVPSYTAGHILAKGEYWWNIAALESLCKAGLDLEMTDRDGNSVLQCALNGKKSGSWGIGFWRDQTLDVVLRHGANINTLSDENGLTPLTSALESRRSANMIKRLVNAGANITLGEKPAIFTAIESGDLQTVEVIIEAGGDLNTLFTLAEPRFYGKGPQVETPLLAAALCNRYCSKSDREAIMSFLLQRGADPIMELHGGETTVFHQISYHHGVVTPLLKFGVDPNMKDSLNRTPLLLACSSAEWGSRASTDDSTLRDLILGGADVHATDQTGSTPLALASQCGRTRIVKLLLKKGAIVSPKDNAGLTPLYYALAKLHFESTLEITKALLSAGADPLIRGPHGESPLHLLAPILIELSPAGDSMVADVNARRKEKIDFLTEFKKLYHRFIDSGWDRSCRDDRGNTPLWPYVLKVKLRNDYFRVDPPAEKDVKQMFDDHDVFAVNYEGDTLLHAVATRADDAESASDGLWLFKDLMRRGLDARQQNKTGMSALDIAATFARQDILDLFAREE